MTRVALTTGDCDYEIARSHATPDHVPDACGISTCKCTAVEQARPGGAAVKPEVISVDEFCAFCFGPLATGWNVERRGRHYCTPEHADADQRKHGAVAAIDEFTTTPVTVDQLELGGGDG